MKWVERIGGSAAAVYNQDVPPITVELSAVSLVDGRVSVSYTADYRGSFRITPRCHLGVYPSLEVARAAVELCIDDLVKEATNGVS